MTPSVRGWQKVRVVLLLLAAAGATGALSGFVVGVVWLAAGLPAPTPSMVAAVVAVTALADGLFWWKGRPAPFAVRRQVPRVWSSLFSPETVAVLYGGRLGAGPLTMLPTWAWWTAVVLAGTTGPGGGAGIGWLFGVMRVVLMVVTAAWARKEMASRMATLQRQQVAVSVLIVMTYLLLLPISLALA